MNLLRELRKFKRKSVIAKVRILLLLAILLLSSSFAWFHIQEDVTFGPILGKIEYWDLDYTIDDETVLTETVDIAIDEFYPGSPDFEKNIIITNKSAEKTTVKYDLLKVTLFENIIYEKDEETKEVKVDKIGISTATSDLGTTVNLFQGKTVEGIKYEYPFDVWYFYDKEEISEEFVSETETPNSIAKFSIYAKWPYEQGNKESSITNNVSGNNIDIYEYDELDVSFGKNAYDYYQEKIKENPNIEIDKIGALVLTFRIESKRAIDAEINI